MKMIYCLKDLNNLAGDLPNEMVKYLRSEFSSLFEYLSNGEEIQEFKLPTYQAMVVIENEKELDMLFKKTSEIELEFIDGIHLENIYIKRIGIQNFQDIQLHYALNL